MTSSPGFESEIESSMPMSIKSAGLTVDARKYEGCRSHKLKALLYRSLSFNKS